MKRLLIIAYYFPPDGGAGTQRSVKFAKYLGEFGWQPTILTRACEGNRGKWDPEDASLMKELSGDTEVIRVSPGTSGRRSYFRISDLPAESEIAFYEKAVSLCRQSRFDAIFVTMSPFGMATVGNRLRKGFESPIIYDLRDPWAFDGWHEYRSKLHWYLDYQRMKRTLRGADGIVANTPESAKSIRALVSAEAPVATIPNGYDESDFRRPPVCRAMSNDTFVLVHAGTLHSHLIYNHSSWPVRMKRAIRYRREPIQPVGRTEYFLFKAIRDLRDSGHQLGHAIRFICVGNQDVASARCAREFGVEDCVQYTGYVSHEDSIDWLYGADALFLPLHGLPRGRRSLIVPGKTYEYLASGKPIIGALPEGDAKDLVLRYGNGYLASPCDSVELKKCLISAFEKRESVTKSTIPADANFPLKTFERRHLAGDLATFLDQVIDRRVQNRMSCSV